MNQLPIFVNLNDRKVILVGEGDAAVEIHHRGARLAGGAPRLFGQFARSAADLHHRAADLPDMVSLPVRAIDPLLPVPIWASDATLGPTDVEVVRREAIAKLHPLPRLGEPDDIAWGCVYLASDEAKFVTGATLTLNAPELDKAVAQDLLEKAHQVCPYSKATRGNVEVKLVVA